MKCPHCSADLAKYGVWIRDGKIKCLSCKKVSDIAQVKKEKKK